MLPKALASLRDQTYNNIEIIVVPDGCTDNTLDYLHGLPENWKIRIIPSQTATGPSAARNRGIMAARGEFVAFLDDDDTWVKEKLERQVALATQGFFLITCTSAYYKLKGVTSVYGKKLNQLTLNDMLLRNYVISVTPLLQTNLARKYRFDEKLWVGEEWDLWIRLLRDGISTRNISDPLINYYRSADASLNKLRMRRFSNRVRIYKKHKNLMNNKHRFYFIFITLFKFMVPDLRYLVKSLQHRNMPLGNGGQTS